MLTKIADAKKAQIIPEVKYVLVKIEEPKPKYDDVVMKKEPKIHLHDEPLPDLNAYDNWFQKIKNRNISRYKAKNRNISSKYKAKNRNNFSQYKVKNRNNFPRYKAKNRNNLSRYKAKTEIFLPEIKPAIKPFPIDEPLLDLKKYDYWLDNRLNNPLNDNVDGQT